MATNGKLIILNGPHHSGKSIEAMMIKDKVTHVDVADLLSAQPQASLRQILNQEVISPLLKGETVVLEGCGDTYARRSSVVNLLEKKVPGCKPECFVIRPLGGVAQSLWLLENLLAECALEYHEKCCHANRNWSKIIDAIENWEDQSDDVIEEEGLVLIKRDLPIRIQTFWKFDVPALFIQWDSLLKQSQEGVTVITGAVNAINTWYASNPCGRVIIIHEGASQPGVSSTEKDHQITGILKTLSASVTCCPVYLLHVTKPALGSGYCKPPQPGLIAFLHRLHHVDLASQGTVYWYISTSHMKMAENAGVKNIKAARVYAHANLVASNTGLAKPRIPEMLAGIEYIEPLSKWCPGNEDRIAAVPLMKQALEGASDEKFVCANLEAGRVLYMAFCQPRMLAEYEELYISHVRAVKDTSHNKMAALSARSRTPRTARQQEVYHVGEEERGLPEWMIPKKKATPKRGGLRQATTYSTDASEHKATTSTGLKSRNGGGTVYVMSEQELLDIAERIIRQSGESLPTEREIRIHQQRQQQQQQQRQHQQQQQSAPKQKLHSPEKSKISRLDVRPVSADDSSSDELMPLPPGGYRRKPPPSRKKVGTHGSIFDDIVQSSSGDQWVAATQEYDVTACHSTAHAQGKAGAESSADSAVMTVVADSLVSKSSSSRKSSISLSERKQSSGSSSVKTVPDSIVGNSSSVSRNSISPRHARTLAFVSDSFVPDSKSSRSSLRSTAKSGSTRSVPDSLVKNTESTKSSSDKNESGSMKCIPDSFVNKSSSTSPRVSSHSPTSVTSVADSLVKNSSSLTSPNSVKVSRHGSGSAQTVADSFVKETPSVSSKELSRSTSKDAVSDSLVSKSLSVDSKCLSRSGEMSDGVHVVLESSEERPVDPNKTSKTKASDSQIDISFLDDLI